VCVKEREEEIERQKDAMRKRDREIMIYRDN
jgi:hypothetical protein